MAEVANQARLYLERSVPELREWQDKELFTADEVRTIVSKRNNFEHRCLASGSTAADWLDYANWERSLNTLREKRARRMKVHRLQSSHAGQGRILTIYRRSVTKFPGELKLRLELLNYLNIVGASKKFRTAMTDALRMMPNTPQLWILAGTKSAAQGDMTASRNFFLRGCEFCKKDGRLWVEYANCEMMWLGRQEKKGKKAKQVKKDAEDDMIQIDDVSDDDLDADGMIMPEAEKKTVATEVVEEAKANPAMDGAIPLAIFDISRKQKFFNAETAAQFFDMFTSQRSVSVQPRISQHVLDAMDEAFPNDPSTCDCHIRAPIHGIDVTSGEFPKNLRESVKEMRKQMEVTTDQEALQEKTRAWIDGYLALEHLDESIRQVLQAVRPQEASSS